VGRGADLQPSTLIAAYRAGIFPMPTDLAFDDSDIAWWSPIHRGILPLDSVRVTRSMRRSSRKYHCTENEQFERVMRGCAAPNRPGGWISEQFIDAYVELHNLGWAHSIEVLDGSGTLVGGLYGVRIDGLFAGESMFHLARDASKVALMHLVDQMRTHSVHLLDVQWLTPHLATLGAIEISRDDYLGRLAHAITA
jgi:leucyl/phenylalanyl-tRNA--protein transferase